MKRKKFIGIASGTTIAAGATAYTKSGSITPFITNRRGAEGAERRGRG